jgi:8-hydroxy-5-deazaflavin:NADPH oxidoreductase
MKIGIIGAGNVGQALGEHFKTLDYEVIFGVRNPLDPKYNMTANSLKVAFKTIPETVAWSSIVILATPWSVAESVLQSCGKLQGKILVDCTNPIKPDFTGLDEKLTVSGAEKIAQWAPGAKVVKCFNHTGYENLARPKYGAAELVMFAAGDDRAAVETIVDIAENMGFKAMGLNSLKLARHLEYMAWLWIELAVKQKLGTDLGFALIER